MGVRITNLFKRLRQDLKEVVAMAKRLRRASPQTGERMSYRQISARLGEAGYGNDGWRALQPEKHNHVRSKRR